MGIARAAALLLAAGLSSASALAGQAWEAGTDGLLPVPPLAARVTDLTQTLSASERQALEAKLADWEARTSNQLVVLLVPTTQPEPIEAYSLRVAEKWKIGRKGQDNGALFLVAKSDRKMRIEVGYGLEGVLPDVTANRIIREDVAPAFRDGRFAAGINAGVDRIMAVVGGQSSAPSGINQIASKVRGSGLDFETIFVILFFVIPIAGGILRRLFGRLGGSVIGGGGIGALIGFFAGSIVLGFVAWGIAFLVMLAMGMGGGMASRGGRGGWTSTGGGWGGGGWSGGSSSSSSGGFSGGGGSFGGGGSSGSW